MPIDYMLPEFFPLKLKEFDFHIFNFSGRFKAFADNRDFCKFTPHALVPQFYLLSEYWCTYINNCHPLTSKERKIYPQNANMLTLPNIFAEY
jgi:hypothetical protein